jgi:putative transcriptional regulator
LTIIHHLDEATILSYAAGTLGEALSFAAACHISMCSECRTAVRNAEALGGEILDDLEATAISDVRRAATLASLDDTHAAKPAVVKSDMPAPLQRLLHGQGFAQLRWRKKAPGVSVYELPLSKGVKVR